MARITVETGKRSFLSRIVLLIVGLALIFICLVGLALQFFGKTASATITKVTFTEEANSDRDYYTTTACVSYFFSVDGKEYSGHTTFSVSSNDRYAQTGAMYLTDYDLEFREKWKDRKALQIKYMPAYPKMNDAAENTKNSVSGTFLRVAGIALALLLMIVALKPNKKQKAVNTAAQPTVQNVPYAKPIAPPGYHQTSAPQQPAQANAPIGDPTPPQQTKNPKFCPNCGAAIHDEGSFCANCGNKLI